MSLLAFFLVTTAQGGQWEVRGGLEALFADDNLWDQATGGEIKAVYWKTDQIGLGFSTGISQWNTDGRTRQVTATRWQSWKGDAQYVPLGVSILTQSRRSPNGTLLGFEAGLHHLFGRSDMSLTETNRIPAAPGFVDVTNTYDVELDDGLVARVAAILSQPIGDQSRISISGGYQFDLNKGDATVDSIGLVQEIELAAFFVQIGVAIPFR